MAITRTLSVGSTETGDAALSISVEIVTDDDTGESTITLRGGFGEIYVGPRDPAAGTGFYVDISTQDATGDVNVALNDDDHLIEHTVAVPA